MEKRTSIFLLIPSCFFSLILTACACSKENPNPTPIPVLETQLMDSASIEVMRTFTDKTLYSPEASIKLQPFLVKNLTARDIILDTMIINISIAHANEAKKVLQKTKAITRNLEGNGQMEIPGLEIVRSDDGLGSNGYLVHADLILSVSENGQVFKQKEAAYLTFFRITERDDDLAYSIGSTSYDGLPIFTLRSGLSAEYTVQKAAAALAGGMSHSWNIPAPGMGPAPIKSSPDFLQRSLQQTIDFYENTFGESKIFETVIISTGIPSGAYLARAMNAPVLPIHFLVGVHTIKEVQTMLDYSETQGTHAYATIGHDYSLSNNTAVAWIKLLSLPTHYQQFLTKHQVRNVIFHGALGLGGESTAKKLKDSNDHYGTGSIYLMHFAGSQSETYLQQTIRDFEPQKLGSLINISDWEAGVIDQQVNSMSVDIKVNTAVQSIDFITTRDAIHLWNMGTYMTLHLLKKNNLELKGISFNPYLIGHPVFETFAGFVPFLYWQGFEPQHHIENRLNNVIEGAVKYYFPNTNFKALSCWVNSTENFGGSAQGLNMANALRQHGFEDIVNNDYTVGEEWQLTDGLQSPVEVRAQKLVETGVEQLREWNAGLAFLTMEDIREIAGNWGEILVISK